MGFPGWSLQPGGREPGGAGLGDTHENAIPCLQSFHGQREVETFMESDAAPLYPSPHSRILVALPCVWKLWGQG